MGRTFGGPQSIARSASGEKVEGQISLHEDRFGKELQVRSRTGSNTDHPLILTMPWRTLRPGDQRAVIKRQGKSGQAAVHAVSGTDIKARDAVGRVDIQRWIRVERARHRMNRFCKIALQLKPVPIKCSISGISRIGVGAGAEMSNWKVLAKRTAAFVRSTDQQATAIGPKWRSMIHVNYVIINFAWRIRAFDRRV